MATTWLPKNNFDRRSFLLTNGDIVQEPPLEETSTGLKVRIAGTTESAYSRDQEVLIRKGLDQTAQTRKARFWMPVDIDGRALRKALNFVKEDTPAQFDPAQNASPKAIAWWSFKHPTLPIEAVLTVQMTRQGWGGNAGYAVHASLVLPNLNPCSTQLDQQLLTENSPAFECTVSRYSDDGRSEFENWIKDNPPEWTEDVFGMVAGRPERAAVEQLLNKVRTIEELDEIQVPDTRDGFDWLTLKLHDTNVNNQFIEDLREYLTGASGIERAQEVYGELVQAFRSIGMVMDSNLSENDFMQALLQGDSKALTVKLSPATNDDDTHDNTHVISVHLPTGTFVVSCGVARHDKDKVAHAWEESLVLAKLTGKEDVLLAYAEEYVRAGHDRRTKKIVNRRKRAVEN